MLWNYLRDKVKNSVLAGIGDALAEVEGDGTEDTSSVLHLLRQRLQPTLPAPTSAPDSNGTASSSRGRKRGD